MSSLWDTIFRWNDIKQKNTPWEYRRPRESDVPESQEVLKRLLAGTGASADEVLSIAAWTTAEMLDALLEANKLPAEHVGVIAAAVSTAWIDGLGTGLHHRTGT